MRLQPHQAVHVGDQVGEADLGGRPGEGGVGLIVYGWTSATPPLLRGRLTQNAHVVLYLACTARILRLAIVLQRTPTNYPAGVEQEAGTQGR
jgi:hypothetical protein